MEGEGSIKNQGFSMAVGPVVITNYGCVAPQEHGTTQLLYYLWDAGLMETLIDRVQYGAMCVGARER